MPRLAILCEHPTLSGGERSMLSVLGAIRGAGFEPCVLAPARGPLAGALREVGLEVTGFSVREEGRRLPQEELRQRLARALARVRPDLLHANSLSMGRLSGPVARALSLPSLAHLRDIVGLSRRAVDDLNRHDRLLAVSEATRTFHLARGLDPRRTFVLHNGVDLERFRPRPAAGWLHRELDLPRDAPLVGAIGQIGPRKGLDLLLEAAAILADPLPRAHYLLVGRRLSEKDETRRFEARLHAMALPGRVHFLGYRADVSRLLAELTLLVHPARQEPLGRVLLEGAAAGKAIVATRVGGTPEIFSDGSARLVPPEDPAALAEAIRELVEDASARRRLERAARARAEDAFDAGRSAAGLIEHYRRVLET